MKPPRITCDLKPALTRTAEQLLDYTTLTLRAPGVGVEYFFCEYVLTDRRPAPWPVAFESATRRPCWIW